MVRQVLMEHQGQAEQMVHRVLQVVVGLVVVQVQVVLTVLQEQMVLMEQMELQGLAVVRGHRGHREHQVQVEQVV